LETYPGLSTYDLAGEFLTSPGTIFKAIEKLNENGQQILSKKIIRNNQTVNIYYTKESEIKSTKPKSVFSLPKSKIKNSILINSILKGKAKAYLDIDNNKIFVYPHSRSKLEEEFFSTNIKIKEANNEILFLIPEKISKTNNFNLDDKEIDYEIHKDHIVLLFTDKKYQLPEIKPKRVLIIDDFEDNVIKNIREYLEEKNHKVSYVKSQKIGLEKIKSKSFDFLVLDWAEEHNTSIKHERLMYELFKKNPKGRAVIITGEDFNRDDVIAYTKKGIVWFYDKIEDNLHKKIERDMKSVLRE